MRKRRPRGFWRREYGGAPAWFIGAAALATLVLVAGVGAYKATATAAPVYTPKPLIASGMEDFEAAPTKAVFIGDSYTAGAGGSAGFVPAVCTALGWGCSNLGVGGTSYIYDEAVAQKPSDAQNACGRDYCPSYVEVLPDAAELKPDVVVVNGGRNMWWATPDLIAEEVPAFFTALRAALPDSNIVVISPIWDDDPEPEIMGHIRTTVRDSAIAAGATYIDIGEPFEGRGDLITDDGVHPNQAGYDLLATVMTTDLRKAGL